MSITIQDSVISYLDQFLPTMMPQERENQQNAILFTLLKENWCARYSCQICYEILTFVFSLGLPRSIFVSETETKSESRPKMFYHVRDQGLLIEAWIWCHCLLLVDISGARNSAASAVFWSSVDGHGETEVIQWGGRNLHWQIWIRDSSNYYRPYRQWHYTAWSRICRISREIQGNRIPAFQGRSLGCGCYAGQQSGNVCWNWTPFLLHFTSRK